VTTRKFLAHVLYYCVCCIY